jgi:hypothetical protein
MFKETTKGTKKPVGWSVLRRQLTNLEKPALVALLKDLYELCATWQATSAGGFPITYQMS